MLDWLYGPRLPADLSWSQVTLRNLTLDVEALFDASREIPEIVKRSRALRHLFVDSYPGGPDTRPLTYTSTTEYRLRGRTVSEDDIRALGTSDRGQILMLVSVVATEDPPQNAGKPNAEKLEVLVDSSMATVRLTPDVSPKNGQILRDIADNLYANSTPRPHWRGAKWLAWLAPIPVALGAWLWLAFTNDWPLALHILVIAVIVLSGSGAVARALATRSNERDNPTGKSFRYRGESRKETQQRRADSRTNVKVAVITAVVTAPIGLILGLLTGK